MARVAIIGARRHRALAQVLRRVRELPDGTTVVSGEAKDGVDAVAKIGARQRGLPYEGHPPDYATHGDRAPLVRNGTIAESCDEMEAFPWDGARGTWHAVGKVKAACKPVRIHEPDVEHQALLVFSARVTYKGPGAFCVMRFGGGPEAEPFAPTADLLRPALAARERANELRRQAAKLRSPQAGLFDSVEEKATREARATSLDEQAEEIEAAAFATYEPGFRAEMSISSGRLVPGAERWLRLKPSARELAEEAWKRGARPRPEAWKALLGKTFIVLQCACVDARRCHRAILRETILPALGAVDGGEVS